MPPKLESLNWGTYSLPLRRRTAVMGILNVTPDSFSDGGKYFAPALARQQALRLVREGADILDIGGESTRPGAEPVDASHEIGRVVPVIEAVLPHVSVPISVDTTKADVARRALQAGASMVNDISGFHADPELPGVAAEFGVPVVLMHIKGTPRTMQEAPRYEDLFGEVEAYLVEGIETALRAGVAEEHIIVDPGIGFGKTLEHNLSLINGLGRLKEHLGYPVLVGPSRKSFIGKLLELPPDQRMEGTAAAVAVAIVRGADIVRVHDVEAMVRIVRVVDAIIGKAGDLEPAAARGAL